MSWNFDAVPQIKWFSIQNSINVKIMKWLKNSFHEIVGKQSWDDEMNGKGLKWATQWLSLILYIKPKIF